MPEIDFLLLCDYVRAEGGLFHIIGGGVDRIRSPRLPSVHSLGIAARMTFGVDEMDRDHDLGVIFRDPDGALAAEVRGAFRATPETGGFALNVSVPLQSYGTYTFELAIDNEPIQIKKIVVELPPGA